MDTAMISGALYARMIRAGADRLYDKRTVVNDLNVFPIPDGDTGDNMYMTIDAGALCETGDGIGDAASSIAKGMLLGARGNSGVILSRIFAGIAEGLSGVDEADAAAINAAFLRGKEQAYNAVSNPVEGTILTVMREAVEYAGGRLNEKSTVESYFEDFVSELKRSLERTPDMLGVLKEAGVVDSGGAGLVYIAEGMKDALCGIALSERERRGVSDKAAKPIDISQFTEDSVLEYGYCTELLLRLQNSKTKGDFDEKEFSDWLNKNGESVVVFRDGSIVKLHVHTMTPGVILDYCQRYGEFLTLKIENMMLQHSVADIKNNYEKDEPTLRVKPHKPYGIVVVAAGEGIKQTFLSLGADEVVDGGQSMNPSAADFIRAFERINADTILVYPNNGNIIFTAQQAAELYDKAEIRVIKSRTIGEGYSSLSMLDYSSGDTDAIVAEAEEIISGVVTGTVSKASRDTQKDGVSVKEGDYIGFADDVIYVDDRDPVAAAEGLCDKLNAGKRDVILIICGSDTSDDDAKRLCLKLQEKYKRTEVIMINGGQPIYDYIIVFE